MIKRFSQKGSCISMVLLHLSVFLTVQIQPNYIVQSEHDDHFGWFEGGRVTEQTSAAQENEEQGLRKMYKLTGTAKI